MSPLCGSFAECDKLMENDALKIKDSPGFLCKECFGNTNQVYVERNESIQEMFQCLKSIEYSVRVTRTPKQKIKKEREIKMCDICD